MIDRDKNEAEQPAASSVPYADLLSRAQTGSTGSEIRPEAEDGDNNNPFQLPDFLRRDETAETESNRSLIPEVQISKDIERAVNELQVIEVFPGEPGYEDALPVYTDETPEAAIETTQRRLVGRAWWERAFNNVADFEQNPFTHKPTEELLVRGSGSELRLLNFSEQLTEQETAELKAAITMIYQAIGERLFELVPWIVMSDTRQPMLSQLTGTMLRPFGVAHKAQRDRFIDLSHDEILSPEHVEHQQRALDRYPDAKIPDAKLKLLPATLFQLALIHEIGHMLDPLDGKFEHEIGWTKKGNVRGISEHTGKVCVATESGDVMVALEDIYSSGEIEASLPTTDYAYTSASEDFADAFTLLIVSPDRLDPIRRDLVLQALQANPRNPHQLNPVASPIVRPSLEIRRVTGPDIVYPRVPIPERITYKRDSRNVIDLL